MKEKAFKAKKYHKRRMIEDELILQGIIKPKTFAARKHMAEKDAELIAEELDIKARGFCCECYMVMGYENKCINPSCSQYGRFTFSTEQEEMDRARYDGYDLPDYEAMDIL